MTSKEYVHQAHLWENLIISIGRRRIWEYSLKPFYTAMINIHLIKIFRYSQGLVTQFCKVYKETEHNTYDPLVSALIKKNVDKQGLYVDVVSVFSAGIIHIETWI